MANYQDIKGFNIQSKSSDPVPFAQEKINNPYAGVWSSGGSLSAPKSQIAGFGTVSAAGAAMGKLAPGTLVTNYEVYNGTSWTESTDINTAGRNGRGAGTTTAALVFGGWPRAGATETWNGSAWTEVNEMTRGATASQSQAAFGTNTAALAAGGEPGTGGFQLVETWNGTSWTEVNELNTGRQGPVGFGITTAGFVISGYSPPAPPGNVVANVESWNGSAWTETTDINTARGQGGASGTTTAGLVYGGSAPPGVTAVTESWNGSAWTEVNDLATAKQQFGFNSNPATGSTDAIAMGGEDPSLIATTAEWTFAGIPPSAPSVGYSDSIVGDMYYNSSTGQFKAIKSGGTSIGVWSSGAAPPLNVQNMGGAGTQTAAVSVGGFFNPGPPTNLKDDVLLYNGVSWSTNPNSYPIAVYGMGSAGTQTAGLFVGGVQPGGPGNRDVANKFDGTSWTSASTLTSARRFLAASGTQTAGKATGGYTTTQVAIVEDYNGTSWTETTDMSNPRQQHAQIGASTAALVVGKSPASNIVESWNGSSWTAVNTLNTGRQSTGASGTNTYGIVYAGENSGGTPQATTESWDGTSWTEVGDLATARYGVGTLGYSAPADTAVTWGGQTTPVVVTEEWNAADFEIKTVTTS